MPKRVYQWVLYALLLAFVVGCGGTTNPGADGDGGGGGGGQNPDDGNNGGQPVTTLKLTAESTDLPSAAGDITNLDLGVELMAMLTDGSSSTLPADGVFFDVTGGDTGAGTTLYDPDPNDNKAILLTGGDPIERTITVLARANGLTDTIKVNVTGTTLAINGPTELLPGDTATYTATLSNSAGEGIAGQTIDVALTSPLTTPSQNVGQTDANGQIEFDVIAANQEGTGSFHATALRGTETAALDVTVSETSFQFIAPATDDRSSLPVDTPTTLTVEFRKKASGASTPQPVVGRLVTFKTHRGEFINGTLEATATTDANGQASVDLQSSSSGTTPVTAQAEPPPPPPGGGAATEGPTTEMTVEFVATDADTMTLTATPSSIGAGGDSTLTATVQDTHENPVADQAVDFSIAGSGGSLSPVTATTNRSGIATTHFTAGDDDGYTITAQLDGIPEQSVDISVADTTILVSLGTDGIAHKLQDNNNGDADDDGTTGSTDGSTDGNGDGSGDTGGDGGTGNGGNSGPTYKVNYVAVVTDANGNEITFDAPPRVHLEFLAYQEGKKEHDGNRWAPTYAAPETAAGFGCAPATGISSGATISSVTQQGPSTWAFAIVYPQDHSGWSKLQVMAEASRDNGQVQDQDTAVLLLPMAEEDITAASTDVPPGVNSPYGTDGDCTTQQ